MSNIYHATPYDISAAGFYFNTYEEYADKSVKHRNEYGDPVEEYEIQFIDGDNYQLYNALSVNQANLKQWFDEYEDIEGNELVSAIYLAEYLSCDMDEVNDKLEDVLLFKGSALEFVENYIEDVGLLEQIPDNLQCYFDTKSFAHDMVLSGDISEVEINKTSYIAWGV